MSVMTLSDVWPTEDRPMTVEDLKRQPDDGNTYELVDGVLEVTPAPFNNHNRVATRLMYLLGHGCPDGLEVMGHAGLTLAEDHHRVPDIAIIEEQPLEPMGFLSHPPVLVVEVASRSTRKRDRTTKKREYEEFGIESYWIVDPDVDRPSLTAFELHNDRYRQAALVSGSETFHAARPFPVSIVPRLLVEPGSAWKPRSRTR